MSSTFVPLLPNPTLQNCLFIFYVKVTNTFFFSRSSLCALSQTKFKLMHKYSLSIYLFLFQFFWFKYLLTTCINIWYHRSSPSVFFFLRKCFFIPKPKEHFYLKNSLTFYHCPGETYLEPKRISLMKLFCENS